MIRTATGRNAEVARGSNVAKRVVLRRISRHQREIPARKHLLRARLAARDDVIDLVHAVLCPTYGYNFINLTRNRLKKL